MKAPLVLGNDLSSSLDNATLSVISNRDAISVNQDGACAFASVSCVFGFV